jgi:hypothetical protein
MESAKCARADVYKYGFRCCRSAWGWRRGLSRRSGGMAHVLWLSNSGSAVGCWEIANLRENLGRLLVH